MYVLEFYIELNKIYLYFDKIFLAAENSGVRVVQFIATLISGTGLIFSFLFFSSTVDK